nr:hypothetical protein Iba_chr04dCG18740 [Ipomoea batatas]
MFLLQTISSQIDRLRISPISSSFATVDNICNPAPIGDDGEEGTDDWVGSGFYVEFGGKGFLRVFVKLMMKMAINGNGRKKVVKRINERSEKEAAYGVRVHADNSDADVVCEDTTFKIHMESFRREPVSVLRARMSEDARLGATLLSGNVENNEILERVVKEQRIVALQKYVAGLAPRWLSTLKDVFHVLLVYISELIYFGECNQVVGSLGIA